MEAIITQGDPENPDNYVDTYTVQYTDDKETWLNVTNDEGDPVVSTLKLLSNYIQLILHT